MRVVWSSHASNSHLEILTFLLFTWNHEVAENFNTLIIDAENQLKQFPLSGRIHLYSIRKIVLHKNASFYYEFNQNSQTITILLFIDNRANPKEYLKLL